MDFAKKRPNTVSQRTVAVGLRLQRALFLRIVMILLTQVIYFPQKRSPMIVSIIMYLSNKAVPGIRFPPKKCPFAEKQGKPSKVDILLDFTKKHPNTVSRRAVCVALCALESTRRDSTSALDNVLNVLKPLEHFSIT